MITGSLTENLNSVLKDESREACDEQSSAAKLELVHALDSNAAAIEAFAQKSTALTTLSAEFRRVPFGPIMVQEALTPRAPKPGWRSFSSSWKSALNDFNALKNRPVNGDWLYLNSDVRSLLSEDIDRVVRFRNPYLDKDAGPYLELLELVVENCANREDCSELSIPDSLRGFLAAQPNYNTYLRSIKSKTIFSDRRRMISRFLTYVRGDAGLYKFHVNPNMKSMGGGRYILTIDPGPFSGAPAQLKEYVEGVWRSSFAQVYLRFKDSALDSSLFRILLGSGVGERSYVIRENKTVTLFPNVKARSIAHEFGHVMGFNDRYYSVWNAAACEYKVQNSEEDIMSNSNYGVVLDEHWQDLARYY